MGITFYDPSTFFQSSMMNDMASFYAVSQAPVGIFANFGNRFQARVPEFAPSYLYSGGGGIGLFGNGGIGGGYGAGGGVGGGFDMFYMFMQMMSMFGGSSSSTDNHSGGHDLSKLEGVDKIAARFCEACDEDLKGFQNIAEIEKIIKEEVTADNVLKVIEAWNKIHEKDTEANGDPVANFINYFVQNIGEDQLTGSTALHLQKVLTECGSTDTKVTTALTTLDEAIKKVTVSAEEGEKPADTGTEPPAN